MAYTGMCRPRRIVKRVQGGNKWDEQLSKSCKECKFKRSCCQSDVYLVGREVK